MMVDSQIGGRPEMDSYPPQDTVLEKNQLGVIRAWMRLRPDVPIFNPKQISLFATLLDVPDENVWKLFEKLVRTENSHTAGEATESVGDLNNYRRPLSSSAFSVSSPRQSISAEMGHRTGGALEWLHAREEQCDKNTDPKTLKRKGDKIYQCTRCCRGFRVQHDWARHEQENIYPQEAWLCDLQPSCYNNPDFGKRIFLRRYLLKTHFEKCHGIVPTNEDVRTSHMQVNTAFPMDCGFCARHHFQSWKSRIKHIAEHFKKDDKDMRYWGKSADFVPESDSDSESDSDDQDNDEDDDEDGGQDDGQDGSKGVDPDHERNNGNNTFSDFSDPSNSQSGGYRYDHSGNYGAQNGTSTFTHYNSGHQFTLAQHNRVASPVEWNLRRHDGSLKTVEIFSHGHHYLPSPGIQQFKDRSLPPYQAKAFPIEIGNTKLTSSTPPSTPVCGETGTEDTQPRRSSSQLVSDIKRFTRSFSKKSFFTKLRNSKSGTPELMVKSYRYNNPALLTVSADPPGQRHLFDVNQHLTVK